MKGNFVCARMVIEVPRHIIQHVFDNPATKVKSCIDQSIYLWPYIEDEVLHLLLFIFGVTLIEIEEYFCIQACGVNQVWRTYGQGISTEWEGFLYQARRSKKQSIKLEFIQWIGEQSVGCNGTCRKMVCAELWIFWSLHNSQKVAEMRYSHVR